MKRIIISSIILLFAVGCVSSPQKLSSVVQPGSYQELGQNEGKACGFILFNFIPIAFNGVPKRAYKHAIESKGGDALINPTITESWYWCVVGQLHCTHVSGTVIKMNK